MTRPDGFQIADIDVGLLSDPKVRRLWRLLRDQGLMCEALMLFVSTLLESWSSGCRVAVDEAMPMWLEPSDGVLEALRKADLLTPDGRVSESGWVAWFGPASARREQRREAGRAGGLARPRLSDAQAPLEQQPSAAVAPANPTVLPSVTPSVRPEIPPPPAKRGRRKQGTNPRARGTSPRQNGHAPRQEGTSPRQEREERKRGPMPQSIHDILRRAAEGGKA